MQLGAALAQHVLEDARRLARDVLQDEGAHGAEYAATERASTSSRPWRRPISVGAWRAASHSSPSSRLPRSCPAAVAPLPRFPKSASLAPADAVVFARITTDDDSSQWQKAERVLERIPGVRDTLVSAIEQGLSDEGLDWDEDVAPALGDEVVVVATAKLRPIVLLQPESEEKLAALLEKSDEAAGPRRGGRMGGAGREGHRPCRLPCGARTRDDRRRRGFRRRSRSAPRREPRSRVGRHGRSDRRAEPGIPAGNAREDRPRDRLAVRVALRGGRRTARRDGGAHARRRRHALRADALPPRARGCSRRDLVRRDAGCARPTAGPGRRRRPLADDRRRDRCLARRHRRRALRRGRALRPSGRDASRGHARACATRSGQDVDDGRPPRPQARDARCKRP